VMFEDPFSHASMSAAEPLRVKELVPDPVTVTLPLLVAVAVPPLTLIVRLVVVVPSWEKLRGARFSALSAPSTRALAASGRLPVRVGTGPV